MQIVQVGVNAKLWLKWVNHSPILTKKKRIFSRFLSVYDRSERGGDRDM